MHFYLHSSIFDSVIRTISKSSSVTEKKERKERERKKTESRKPFKRPQPRARTRNQATVEWSQERKLFFGDATRHQRGNNFSFFPFFFNGFQFSKFEVGAKFARSIGKPRHWPSQAAESYVFCRLTPVWKFEIFIISTFPDGMMPLPRPAETLTRQLLFDKKKGVSPTHPRRHFLVVSSEKFNFTRVNRYQERNESFLRFISVELAGEKEWKCQLFFTVNGEYKLRCENFFEFNSTPIRTGGGQISRVSSLSPIVVKFGINSPFQFNSIPILKWNIECWEHCILTLCCEIQ